MERCLESPAKGGDGHEVKGKRVCATIRVDSRVEGRGVSLIIKKGERLCPSEGCIVVS